ncbi:hypothetical protein TorRG33x02_116600 [Trema orientale]|uniref:Uncharacterized protein n=1 Tax=Trema orientale TaxID=63057 RepID=A0A2P5F452_TREOI|nr:hypothetical protein TorRG33x02_116600 [Trema orientale]
MTLFQRSSFPSQNINVNFVMHYVGFVYSGDMNVASGRRKFQAYWDIHKQQAGLVAFSLRPRPAEETYIVHTNVVSFLTYCSFIHAWRYRVDHSVDNFLLN